MTEPHQRPWLVKRREHACPVCGRVVTLTGKEANYRQLVSCGDPACTSQLLARAAVDNLKLHDRPPEWEEARKQGHRASPKSGPHETNTSASEWHLIDPVGGEHHFRNLQHFLRTHADLFDPADLAGKLCRAVSGLSKLRPGSTTPRRAWKGWTWSYNSTDT